MKLEGEIIVSKSNPSIKAKGNRYKINITIPDIEAEGTITIPQGTKEDSHD